MNTARVFFIADDDPDDREIFIQALQEIDENCNCITAVNGEEALEKLLYDNLFYPDFIFLDLNMPKMNGRQCLKEIKKHPQLQQIPIIIYSTSAEKKEAQEVLALGAMHFLQKPNRFNDLCEALQRIVR